MPKNLPLSIIISGVYFCAVTAFAQQPPPPPPIVLPPPAQEQYRRPGWSALPLLKRASFDYSEVRNARLLAEAGESLSFLPIDNFTIGNTQGYQIIAPNGEVSYVDDPVSANCQVTLVAQQIETQTPTAPATELTSIFRPTSVVNIGSIDFSRCD